MSSITHCDFFLLTFILAKRCLLALLLALFLSNLDSARLDLGFIPFAQ
jgi:hypothetical protein